MPVSRSCDWGISQAYVPLPSILYGLNYFATSSDFFVVQDNEQAKEAIKHITNKGKYPFCYQKLDDGATIHTCTAIFGRTTGNCVAIAGYAEKIYDLFSIPLVSMVFVKTGKEICPLVPCAHALHPPHRRGAVTPCRIPRPPGVPMSRLGIFVDRKTLSNCRAAQRPDPLPGCRREMGHNVEFLFPVDITKIPKMDALFIRARTDPMNVTYVAARMAEFHGIPVIDDPDSIQICGDKINMYSHLIRKRTSRSRRPSFSRKTTSRSNGSRRLFDKLGTPLIVKEPSTSFSLRVEKVMDIAGFFQVATKVHQDVGLDRRPAVRGEHVRLAGRRAWRKTPVCLQVHDPLGDLQDPGIGERPYRVLRGRERSRERTCRPHVIQLGIDAADAIGNGLYGVDIKNNNGDACVIEVNDNPSLESGEDAHYPRVYEQIVNHLFAA